MEIKQVMVVGGGIMGRGIAYAGALGGYNVTLTDISSNVLNNAKDEVDHCILTAINRGKIDEKQAMKIARNISYTTAIEQSAVMADFIIEAVPEDMELKKQIFIKLDKLTDYSVILATNTSTMSPSEIGSYTSKPEKVIAMHFFNPVPKMKLVEIIRGLETSDETVEVTKQLAEVMGKETVVVNEFPGFVTSRISSLVGNEAFNMLMEGVGTPEEIDRAIKLGLNYPMGPFELGDLVGLDTRLRNLEYLHKTLGERFRPSPLLRKYVSAGRLGKKTGKGIYDYTVQEKMNQ